MYEEIEVTIKWWSSRAILANDGDKEEWIPRSLIKTPLDDAEIMNAINNEKSVTIEVELWFLEKRGWV